MPSLNNFYACIQLTTQIESTEGTKATSSETSKPTGNSETSKKAFSKAISSEEYGETVSADGKTVTCFIPAETGKFFCAFWSYRGRKPFAYSAEFIRDGESVAHLLFSKSDAVRFDGVAGAWYDVDADENEPWFFQFRSFKCTGQDEEGATTVPDYVGRLELIIRKVEDHEVTDSMSVVKPRPNVNAAIHRNYLRAQKEWGNLQDLENEFVDWKDAKPRQTHNTEMMKCDGTVWRNRTFFTLPELPKSSKEDRKNFVASFIFHYTSPDQIEQHTSVPRKHPSSPRCLRRPRLQSSSNNEDDIQNDQRDQASPAKRPRRSIRIRNRAPVVRSPELATDEVVSATVNRPNSLPLLEKTEEVKDTMDIDPAEPDPEVPIVLINAEEDQKACDEINRLRCQLDATLRAIQAKARARGVKFEGDEGNPIVLD